MKTGLAEYKNTQQLIDFFDRYLNEDNQIIYSNEFFCPSGLSSAIKRGQVVAVLEEEEIIAAVRFYPRKKDNVVSIYQFAIDEKHRGKDLLRKMLIFTEYKKFEFVCPKNIDFNNFYKKMGLEIIRQDGEYNYWLLLLNK